MKPGIKTSEFWLAAAIVFFGVIYPQIGEHPHEVAAAAAQTAAGWMEQAKPLVEMAVAALVTMGYGAKRTAVKTAAKNGA